MKIRKKGISGTENKRDCTVTVLEGEGIEIKGKDKNMFGEHIESLIKKRLDELDVKAQVKVEENGSLDYVIMARLEAALQKACGEDLHDVVIKREDMHVGPRRSRMYIPGNNPRMINSAGVYGCDCLILDLEDSVAVGQKEDARYLVKNALKYVDFENSELWVRVNKETAKDDISVIKYGSPHGICLPKVKGKEDVVILDNILEEEGLDAKIMPIVETAKGVENISEIAGAGDNVVAIAFGAEDFTSDMGGKRTWDSLFYARCRIVTSARAHGVQALDTIYPDVENMMGLKEETMKIVEMGFDGKGVIHPNQIKIIHECFMPSDEEVEKAKKIIEAVEEAHARGLGTASLNGRMIDLPVEKRARRILERAQLRP
ncbi:MAG: aldolase/citrate lyase family protein [Candidatus Thermoplasmatota archaeon]|nr:aldolase/citrate lyase family protein [Candidatus Thermoplasmatota archaeon]